MTQLTHVEAAEMSDMMVLNLVRNPDGSTVTRSMELANARSLTRMNFKGSPSLAAVFSDRFTDHLIELIENACTSKMLLMADYLVDLSDMILEGVRVMTTASKQGFEHIMIRFRRFVGPLNVIFKSDYHLHSSVNDDLLATQTLENVFLPLFNFEAYLDTVVDRGSLSEAEAATLLGLKDEISRLRYSSDLLKYMISCRVVADTLPFSAANRQVAPQS